MSKEECKQIEKLINKGKVAGHKIEYAHTLLIADEGAHGPLWPDTRISEAFNVSESAVRNLRKRLVEKGFDAALEREKQAHRRTKLDGESEAECSLKRRDA